MLSQALIQKIVDIGDTLHVSGCAPFRIEKYVQHYAHMHGVRVIVQAIPTAITYQFPDDASQVVIKQLDPPSIDLGLLANTIIRINQSSDEPVPHTKTYRPWQSMLANMAIPPAYLMLVGSTLHAIFIAAALGLMVWLCHSLCQNGRLIIVEFLSALMAGLAVSWVSSLGVGLPIWGLCIAAVVLYVPGLSIANALECLAFNDLVSGTALFAQSMFIFLKLFIGIFIGLSIGDATWGHSASVVNVNEVPSWMSYCALPMISLAIGIIFNARFIDIIYAFPVTLLGMWGPVYFGFGSGVIVGTWATTVCITLYGTWLAKTLKLTGAIYIVQGIIILVPGSRVLMGASQKLFNESLMPLPDVGLSALYLFSAIVAGQITAYALYSQKNRHLIH